VSLCLCFSRSLVLSLSLILSPSPAYLCPRALQFFFGLAILLGAVEMSALAGLVFLVLPCVAVGWLAYGPLPCDRDETMRRMQLG
jgi:hypothetical protein